jgi:Glycosyltransferase family 87
MGSDISVHAQRDLIFRWALLLGALAASFAFVSFGIVGLGRHGSVPFADVRYWYISTDMWLHGADPYDFSAFAARAAKFGSEEIDLFAYPPTSIWLGVPLQLLSLVQAKMLWLAINLLALAAILAGSLKMLEQLRPASVPAHQRLEYLAILAICLLGSPYTINVVWTGNSTLIVTALLMWTWILSYEGSEWLAGLLLAMATAKPQLAILLGLWLLLDRRWTTLLAAAIASLLLMSVPLVTFGPGILIEWLRAMSGYVHQPAIAQELSHNLNLGSVAIGMGAPRGAYLSIAMAVLGILGLGALFATHLRSRLPAPVPFGLLVSLSLLAFYGRDYDLAACAGLLLLGIHCSAGSSLRQALLIGALIALYIPHRLIEHIDSTWLIYWRPVVLLLVTATLTSWVTSKSSPSVSVSLA